MCPCIFLSLHFPTWENAVLPKTANEANALDTPAGDPAPTGFEELLDGVPAFVAKLVSE